MALSKESQNRVISAIDEDIFYTFTSFTSPSTHYSYDLATGESKKMFQADINDVNLNDYVTEQVFYPSADGTKIPMFITYKKGLEKNGKNARGAH